DDIEWKIESSQIRLPLTTAQTQTNNDSLLCPPFDFTKPGYYRVDLNLRGGANEQKLYVALLSENDVTGSAITESFVLLDRNSQSYDRTAYLKVEEAGRYCLGIDMKEPSSTNDMYIGLNKLAVTYQSILPSVATNLAVTPGENYAHTAILEWTNPTTSNIEGVAPTLVKAVISRNGEQVAEVTENLVPGEKSTWVDNEVPGAGQHTYAVEIHGEEGPHADEAPSVKSPWIGAGIEMPYTQENFRDWTFFNVNNDTNSYGDAMTWKPEGKDLYIFGASKTASDDWAISPCLNFEAGEYKITFTPFQKNGQDQPSYSFELYYGTGLEVADMTTKLATVTSNAGLGVKEPQTFIISAADPKEVVTLADDPEETTPVVSVPAGIGTIGFHANQYGQFHVTDFSVSKSETTGVETIEVSNGFAISGSVVLLPENASDVVVADIAGRIIFVADHADSIDLSAFEKGTYVISAVVDGKKAQVKVIR
ncbi:MAG: T9SS type A sorting domain-containing protein, partial [Muribaculaceae bacterium]|nr:T9SS type A sorting domain-containing protein [Muribaculaceae bacterium]